MLKQLYIKNFTLIDQLDIAFRPGFSVITGETGAGKSIILGAIGLLLGNRADSRQVKAGEKKCVVEAHFDLGAYDMEAFFEANDIDFDPADCILRREVSATGKSRAFINDQPVGLSVMRELGEKLVDIHSQHQNLLLQKDDFQLEVVDIIAGDKKELDGYQQCYRQWKADCEALAKLKDDIGRNRENEDFMRFQLKELSEASLQEGEQEQLEHDTELMGHAEDIKQALFEADRLMSDEAGALTALKNATSALRSIERVYKEVGELATRLDSSYIEVKDISQEIEEKLENVDFDPQRYQELSERLDQIYSLEKKYHVESVGELLNLQDKLSADLQNIDNSDEAVKEMTAQVERSESRCRDAAARLTAMRRKAAAKVEKEMQSRLAPLGIPNVRFEVQLTQGELGHRGQDRISFLFSANKSTPLMPVSQVASGGEIARVMLSLKAMISGTVKLPTIIFDEIDTGVSGRVAEKMAQMMREMGDAHRQVISITHLPQIAALGETHYKVAKEETPNGTVTTMTMLDDGQRVTEIAQMLSGSDVSQAAIDNAKTLLERSKKN